MKLRLAIFLITSMVMCHQVALGQTAPKYSNEFLSIGVGARALGMSNAITAIVNDGTSGFWNPAGLTHLQSNLQISLMHTQYFAGIARYDYGSLAFRGGTDNFFAISVIRFGVDDIPDTSELIDAEGNINYDRIRSFSASDMAFVLSYARRIPTVENLSFGANAKIIRRTAGDFAGAWGFGLDAGIQYQTGQWKFAATLRDATTTFTAWSYNFSESIREALTLTGNTIPESSLELTLPRVVLGAARQFSLGEQLGLLTSLDLEITTDGRRNVLISGDPFSMNPNLGMEFSFRNMIFFRAGMGRFQTYTRTDMERRPAVQLNMGVGLNLGRRFTVDYALTNAGTDNRALYSNVFSLRYNIDRRENRQQENSQNTPQP